MTMTFTGLRGVRELLVFALLLTGAAGGFAALYFEYGSLAGSVSDSTPVPLVASAQLHS